MLTLATETRPGSCERHGPFKSRRVCGAVWSKCPTCAAEHEAEDLARVVQRAETNRAADWERRLHLSGLPERFLDRSLECYTANTPGQGRALAFAQRYADDFERVRESGRCGIFIGGVGTGKTHLAAGIGLRVLQQGRSVLYSTVLRAVRRVKDTWSRGAGETEGAAIAAFVAPDLLLLDEVGVQFGSETERLILFDVLNERYEQRRPTLLLSNLDVEGLRGFLGERVFDRLREDGGEVVVFDWPSHRGVLGQAARAEDRK